MPSPGCCPRRRAGRSSTSWSWTTPARSASPRRLPPWCAVASWSSPVTGAGCPPPPAGRPWSASGGGWAGGSAPPRGRGPGGGVVAGLPAVHRRARDHRTRDGRLLGPLLPRYAGWVTTPGAAARSPLEFEHVREGTGVPAPGEDVAVSADAEVQRVVDLVTAHAVRRPGESLLVVTLGIRHATRIEEALRAEVAHNPELRRWLDVHWTGGISEPFLVRPVHRIAGLERDAVLVTVGLARTPHGRVLHRFGVLDGRHGQACLVAALTRARRRTTVVCAFRAEDIAAERVRSDGARLLRDVLDVAAAPHARGEHRAGLAATTAGRPDALVADLARRLREAGLPVAT